LQLSSGEALAPLSIAFETYGALNAERTNAVLVCHSLTGDQFVASPNPITGRPAWWPRIVGPGRPIDTNRFFVICTNVLGGSMGTTGPGSIAPDGQPYGLRFPPITIADTVRAQSMLVEALGIESLFLVIGPGMGGMQALNGRAPIRARLRLRDGGGSGAPIGAEHRASPNLAAKPSWPIPIGAMAAICNTACAQARRRRVRAHRARSPGCRRKMCARASTSARTQERFAFNARRRQRHAAPAARRRLRRSLRRELVSLSLARHGRLRSRRGFRRPLANAFQGGATRHGVFAFTSDWRYPPLKNGRAIARALDRRRRRGLVRRDHQRAWPRRLSRRRARVRIGADRLHRRGRLARGLALQRRRRVMAQLELVHPSPLDLDAMRKPRGDHFVIAQWSSTARACSMSAAATAR
jgi:homoserine O-acetyltransferase